MADEVTERGQLLELLAQCDALIDQIKTGNAKAAEEAQALLAKAQGIRATIQRKLGHRS